MSENAEWDSAITYEEFLTKARENVELIKARFNDLLLNEDEQEFLSGFQNEMKILVIGTDRCNDTAGALPVLARIVSLAPKVEMRILDSDNNTEYHQKFRVNGKRKTPVVLFLSSEFNELCRWVERSNAAYKIINEKSNPSLEDRQVALKKLYSDPEIQRQTLGEFIDLLLRADFILGRH
ncbi:MAG: thioredoxin family protein [Candidatus Thorarchaeota archaeon]